MRTARGSFEEQRPNDGQSPPFVQGAGDAVSSTLSAWQAFDAGLPAWHVNLGKRLVRSPKIFLHDSGLACHLQGVDATAWDDPTTRRRALLENFVFGELERQLGWSSVRAALHHYRSHSGDEVDFLLEDTKGRVVGVEVKATATPGSADVEPLRKLAGELGARFVRGVVLTTGSESVSFDARIHALPISALWSIEASARVGEKRSSRNR